MKIGCGLGAVESVYFIHRPRLGLCMPKGLKQTSSNIVISSGITESAANTFTSERVDLQLNALDNEVFVVLAIDLDIVAPDLLADAVTDTDVSVSTVERTTIGGLSESNCLAHGYMKIESRSQGVASNEYSSTDTPHAMLDYIAIIATNDFYINIQGNNNLTAKAANCRVWGYRARAESSVYAALVQSELLSQ